MTRDQPRRLLTAMRAGLADIADFHCACPQCPIPFADLTHPKETP